MTSLDPRAPGDARPAHRPGTPALALVIALGGWLALRLAFPSVLCDDAHITVRAAQNLAAGHGPVLNAGEPVVVATSLWRVTALAGLHALGIDLVTALRGLTLLGEAVLVALLVALGHTVTGRWRTGTLAALALVANPVFLLTSGSGIEVAPAMALVVAVSWCRGRGRTGTALLLAGIGPWVRPELGILVPILISLLVVERERPPPVPALVGSALALAHPILLWTWTGSPLPRGAAWKLAIAPDRLSPEWWEGTGAVLAQFARALQGRSSYWYMTDTPWIVLAPLAAWGLWRVTRGGTQGRARSSWYAQVPVRALAPWILATSAQVGALVLSGSAYARNFPWYFVPMLGPVALLGVIGLEAAAGRIGTRVRRWLPELGMALVLVPIAGWALPRDQAHLEAYADRREHVYERTARRLDDLLPPGRSIACGEIGVLGVVVGPDREILDLAGLGLPPALRDLELDALVRTARPGAIVVLAITPEAADVRSATEPLGYRWALLDGAWIGLAPDVGAG